MDFQTIIWAFFGGILPALLWLWFWLKEDARNPEPKKLIAMAFLFGMMAVPLALYLESVTRSFLATGFWLLAAWAAIEELLKYGAAHFVAFRKTCIDKSRCIDESIDPAIYLITAALGFAAVENTLFLLTPFSQGNLLTGLLTGNLRFIGAMVLHVAASATIGIAIGLAFYKSAIVKKIYLLVGIFTAILLHTLFNVFIIMSNGSGLFIVFGLLWIVVLILLGFFERLKRLRR